VLIIPPGHAESVRSRRALSARDKGMIASVLVVLAVGAVALVISFATAAPDSSGGCIYLTIPAATGSQQIDQCGAQARDTCASARTPGAFTSDAATSIVAACRKAGLPTET
jgi:hypothetical protein